LSLYYQLNGITRKFAPLAFESTADNDVLLVSHYLRSEPTIGLSKKFYLTTLIGVEKWFSGKTWTGEYEYIGGGTAYDKQQNNGGLLAGAGQDYKLTGVKQSDLETTDLALGIGFSWDIMKRVSLHSRYKWLKHSDKNMPFNDYIGNVVSLELKAFF
jgi:opacity protein-like surface antigen